MSQGSELEAVLNILTEESHTLQQADFETIYQSIKSFSDNEGLSPSSIIKLVKVMRHENISTQFRLQLIGCLNPQSIVPEHAAITVTYCLTKREIPLKIKIKLIKWLISIYKLIEPKENFLYLYEIIFILLEFGTLRSFVSQLLCLMTSKNSVTVCRMKYLLKLYSDIYSTSDLSVLMQMYAQYRPDLNSVFSKRKDSFKIVGQVPVLIKEKIEELQSPNMKCCEIRKIIHSKRRRILITSNVEQKFFLRFSLFFRHALYAEALQESLSNPEQRLLLKLPKIVFELQESIPEAFAFITEILRYWDGYSHSKLIFEVIPYWEICPFETLLEEVLEPIYKYFIVSSVSFKCQVIQCLSSLYKNWSLFELKRIKGKTKQFLNLKGENIVANPEKEIRSLIQHLEKLCKVSLQLHPNHPPELLYHLLSHWEMVTFVHSNGEWPLPPLELICSATFSSNAVILEQVCDLILKYRTEIKENASRTHVDLDTLNLFIFYMCAMLLENTFAEEFNSTDKKSYFSYQLFLPHNIKHIVNDSVGIFNIFHHPSLLLYFKAYLELKGENIFSLKFNNSTVADDYLSYLSSAGLNAIEKFIHAFITVEDFEEGN